MSSVVYGELSYCFACGNREVENMRELESFMEHAVVRLASVTQQTAVHYANLKKYLRAQGAPIPENDIWIAASALEHGCILLTRDQHFKKLPQVNVRFS